MNEYCYPVGSGYIPITPGDKDRTFSPSAPLISAHMPSKEKTGGEKVKPETIKAIEAILSKGDRAEVIPTKDGVKVVRIRREPVK